jgi:hypothetical protein
MNQNDHHAILVDPLTGQKMDKLLAISSHIECLLPRADLALELFSTQWKMLSASLDNEIAQDQKLLNTPTLHPLIAQRVRNFMIARQGFQKQLEAIFYQLPKEVKDASAQLAAIHSGFSHTMPLAQPLIGHPQNIFRDWVWGEKENQLYLDWIISQVKTPPKRILVLAAGAGRIAYDLHRHFSPQFTIALDNSYFFAKSFERIVFGEGLSLTEFPKPHKDQTPFVHHTLKAPAALDDNLIYHLADLNYLPYQEASFDLIVTPWIIDLVTPSLPFLIHNISSLLRSKGLWLNYGPFSISSETPSSHRWSVEEIKEFVRENDLSWEEEKWQQVPYLPSPYSRLQRLEEIWMFKVMKRSEQTRSLLRIDYRPVWLKDLNISVPKDQKVISSYHFHHIPARVFALVDGQRSVSQIAQLVAREFNLNESEAMVSVVNFLTRWSQS